MQRTVQRSQFATPNVPPNVLDGKPLFVGQNRQMAMISSVL
jgi:hypothetical protein